MGWNAGRLDRAFSISGSRFHGDRRIYIGQMAPGGRITVTVELQAADEARRVERLAYRFRQIQLIFPEFGLGGKAGWVNDSHWQPLRRFVEQLLVTWDWGEAFVALNLILKPMIDELFMKHAADLALGQNDHLLGQALYSLNEDSQWHRDWNRALVQMLMADSPRAWRSSRDGSSCGAPKPQKQLPPWPTFLRRMPGTRGIQSTSVSPGRSTNSGLNSSKAWPLRNFEIHHSPDQRCSAEGASFSCRFSLRPTCVSPHGFTSNDCAHFCAHRPSKSVIIVAV